LLLFLLGALSQRYLLPCYRKHLSLSAWARNLPAIAVAFLTLLSLIYFVIPVKPLVKGPIMLLAFVVLCPLTFIFQERFRWDRAFGQLSYPIYLGHMLTVWVAEYVLVRSHVTNTLVRSLINVILAIAFGWALNKLLGEPIERIRSKFKRSSGKQVAHLARTGTE
jgi:peptidoglycan/LPS O-acetylase OafA/YrhL